MTDDNWWRDRPLWFVLWYCVRHFVGTLWRSPMMYSPWYERAERERKHGYCVAPWWAWPLWLLVGLPSFAFEQAYGCYLAFERDWPYWPLNWATRIHNAAGGLIERRATNFAYLPPDSGDPDEIGFHYRADLLKRDPETFDYIDRPRIYDRSAPGTLVWS